MDKQTLQNEVVAPLTMDDQFVFTCDKDLSCFNQCCRNINLYLTPYDILRMKKRLGMDSARFLDKYTIPLLMREIGHPVVILRMQDDVNHTCPFVTSQGCGIYEDRPWSCRTYPLEPICEEEGRKSYAIVSNHRCLGFNKGITSTVKKWRESQRLSYYEAMNKLWAEVTMNKWMDSIGTLDERQCEFFYLASFNLDGFKVEILNGNLPNPFPLNKRGLQSLKTDDVKLMKFAFHWLKTLLFGEDAIP